MHKMFEQIGIHKSWEILEAPLAIVAKSKNFPTQTQW